MMNEGMATRWVTLAVPEDMVQEVLEAVLERVSQPHPPKSVALSPEDAYYSGWTEDELRDVLRNPTRAMGIILRHLATHPEEWVKAPELAKEVYGQEASSNQLGGALGSFTRRVQGRYLQEASSNQLGKETWPFEARQNEETQLWEYRMDARTAEAIRRILGL